MNEVFDGNYYDPDPELYKNLNAYNQAFVDTIRKTGGNNASRWLLIPGWNTNIDHMTLDYGFELPTDEYRSSKIPSDEQRIMISAHYYTPYEFALDTSSSITQWGAAATDSSKKSTWGQEDYMFAQLEQMYTAFSSKGYPVVIGEYCATDKTNQDADNQKSRIYFCEQLCKACKKYGAVPVYWDIGVYGPGASGLIDRKTYEVVEPEIVEAIMKGINADVYPPAEITPSPTMLPSGEPANITVLYKCSATDVSSGGIRFVVDIRNDDTVPVNLEDVKLRYWYTRDDGKWQSFNCYYAVCGCANIWGNMVRIPLSAAYDNADFYSEICFGSGAGVLQPGQSSGQIQITLTKYDNSAYNQADDYSFNGTMTEYGENECITAYVNGNLVYGTEPCGAVPTVTEKPAVSVEPSESTTPVESVAPSESIEPSEDPIETPVPSITGIPDVTVETTMSGFATQRYTISSGTISNMDLSKLAIRYKYTTDDYKAQSFWVDNAGISYSCAPYYINYTSNVKYTFADGFVEISFAESQSLTNGTMVLQNRMNNADWSSYTNFKETGVEVYYDNQLVYTK